jgi:hypothetical protein
MRRYRNRLRYGNDDGPNGGKRQRHLFPKTILAKAKPPKSERLVPQEALFPVEDRTDLATFGGAAPVLADGSLSDNQTLNKYSVKFGQKLASRSVAAVLLVALTLVFPHVSHAYASNTSFGVQGACSGESALTPAKTALRKVVHRRPVPFRPYAHVPEYLLVYCVETLECGHTVETHPQADPLIAVRRRCQECDREVVSIRSAPRKFPVRSVGDAERKIA